MCQLFYRSISCIIYYTLYCFCHYKLPKLYKMNETLSEGLHPLLTVLSSPMVCLGHTHGIICHLGHATEVLQMRKPRCSVNVFHMPGL